MDSCYIIKNESYSRDRFLSWLVGITYPGLIVFIIILFAKNVDYQGLTILFSPVLVLTIAYQIRRTFSTIISLKTKDHMVELKASIGLQTKLFAGPIDTFRFVVRREGTSLFSKANVLEVWLNGEKILTQFQFGFWKKKLLLKAATALHQKGVSVKYGVSKSTFKDWKVMH